MIDRAFLTNLLRSSLAQAKSRWQATAPGTRLASALVVVAILAGAAYVATVRPAIEMVDLFEGTKLTPDDRAKIQAAIAQKGLNSYRIDNHRIRVPRKERDQYLKAVQEAGVSPWERGKEYEDIRKQYGMFTPRDERETLERIAKQRELARILSGWDFVADAAVIIDRTTKSGFGREQEITASVSITPAGADRLDPSQVESVERYMVGSVAGLKPENIQICDANGSVQGDERAAMAQRYEQQWKSKIEGALSYIPGVVVTTNAVLGCPPPHRQSLATDYLANQANVALALRPQSLRPCPSVTSSTETTNIESPLTLSRISVNVSVPNSYFTEVYRRIYAPADQRAEDMRSMGKVPDPALFQKIRTEETANIRSLVANLLPPLPGIDNTAALVNVSTFLDVSEPQTAASNSPDIVAWLWKNPIYAGVGIAAIVALTIVALAIVYPTIRARRIRKKRENDTATLSQETEAAGLGAGTQPHREPTLREELRQLVRSDPAAAARVLESWIGTAG